MEAYTGSIWAFAFNYVPANVEGAWGFCNGSAYNISEYPQLYSLIGTTYGGDGVSKFNVPNLMGYMPIGTGQGVNLTNRTLAQKGGSQTLNLTAANVPIHDHVLTLGQMPAGLQVSSNTPDGGYYGNQALPTAYSTVQSAAPENTMAENNAASTVTGGGAPISAFPPNVPINYCICLNGVWPPHP